MTNIIHKLLDGQKLQYLFSTHGSVRISKNCGLTIEMFKTLGAKKTVRIEIPPESTKNIGLLEYVNLVAEENDDYRLVSLALHEIMTSA